MATGGASAIAGMAAWSSNTAAGIAQATSLSSVGNLGGSLKDGGNFSSMFSAKSMPKLAEGGLTYGATLAQIGEGKYEEAVLPLSDTVFDRLGDGINRANGGAGTGGATININAIDAESFGGFLESRGGRALRQFLVNQDRGFVATAGTW